MAAWLRSLRVSRGAGTLLLAGAYLAAPGHPDLPVSGLPLGLAGLAALVTLATLYVWTRGNGKVRKPRLWVTWAIAQAVFLKVMVGVFAPPVGWQAAYFANPTFSPPVERSIDYPGLREATRIDRAVDFAGDRFPVHFFNDRRFNFGERREVTEPFSVHWTGHLNAVGERTIPLALEARGRARVYLNELEVLSVIGDGGVASDSTTLTLIDGRHVIEVRYSKPAETEGLVRLLHGEGPGRRPLAGPDVTTVPSVPWRAPLHAPLGLVAWIVHAGAAGLVGWWLLPAALRRLQLAAARRHENPLAIWQRVAEPFVVLSLTAQGVWKARHLVDRTWSLTGGDDWLAYEAGARDVALNGLLMPLGTVPGEGVPFFYYPGYAYILALVHRVGGESLAGVTLANFVMLALGMVIVHRLAIRLVGSALALAAVAWVFLLGQLDFVRHYTVTLLSENAFFLAVPASVYGLTRYVADPRRRWLLAGAVAGGAAALIRPSMMLFLPPACAIVAAARWRRAGPLRALGLAALFAAAWMATISPATLRNHIMSGKPVLITAGQAFTFVEFNLPEGDHPQYMEAFDGTILSAGRVLFQIIVDHPAEMLRRFAGKAGFSLGMVHWHEGYAAHPELVLTSVLYLAAFLLVPAARRLAAVPVHAFIAAHLATLLLTTPWNYGYRLLLVMYLLMPVFAVATLARLWAWRRPAGDSPLRAP